MGRRNVTTLASLLATATAVTCLASPAATARPADQATATATALPPVSPTPQSIGRAGSDAPVTGRVLVVADDATDSAALDRLVAELKAHGARRIDVVTPGHVPPAAAGLLTVRLGSSTRPDIVRALGATKAPDHAEG